MKVYTRHVKRLPSKSKIARMIRIKIIMKVKCLKNVGGWGEIMA